MNKRPPIEWSEIVIAFALGFVLCLIAIGFWPAGLEEKHEYGGNYSAEGRSTYYEISKAWGEWLAATWERTSEDPVALYALVLGILTALLVVANIRVWVATKQLADGAERMERAYLTGGGDIVSRGGGRFFRIDVANYGKTVAYLTHYEIRFATKLTDVQEGPRKVYEPCKQYVFDDRIAPDNKTKKIGYIPMDPQTLKSSTDAFGTPIGEKKSASSVSSWVSLTAVPDLMLSAWTKVTGTGTKQRTSKHKTPACRGGGRKRKGRPLVSREAPFPHRSLKAQSFTNGHLPSLSGR
jgi:hypothetical protein